MASSRATEEVDELFELKNLYYLGSYQAALNEGMGLKPKAEPVKVDRDVFLYRSYMAQGNSSIVIEEIKDSSPSTSLQSVRLLASYLSNRADKETVKVTLSEWMKDGSAMNNPIFQVIAASIFYVEQNYEEAWKLLSNPHSLEAHALMIQILLKMDRVDLAEREMKKMVALDEDAVLTQLSQAWINLSLGQDKLNDALLTFQELIDKFSPTGMLLNACGLVKLHQKKFQEAERLFLDALDKSPKDGDIISNLITCYLHSGKSQEVINRYLNQLRNAHPNHAWVQNYKNMEDSFSRNASRFAA